MGVWWGLWEWRCYACRAASTFGPLSVMINPCCLTFWYTLTYFHSGRRGQSRRCLCCTFRGAQVEGKLTKDQRRLFCMKILQISLRCLFICWLFTFFQMDWPDPDLAIEEVFFNKLSSIDTIYHNWRSFITFKREWCKQNFPSQMYKCICCISE